jgi:hypothetical protein
MSNGARERNGADGRALRRIDQRDASLEDPK